MQTKEEWEKIKDLFTAALDRSPTERAVFIEQACGQNQSLREEIESLLRAHESPNSVLERTLTTPLAQSSESRTIGPYRLLMKLGEGGMGQVWLAEQTAPLQRRVALKLIRWGMYDDALLRRFETERQSLALMDHPSIAKIFDAGTTTEGQPFFVMEHVPGVPITDYCDQKKLKIRDRLDLFIKVCEAVQHAHQKAIMHRDLKPANILVVEVDGKPVPRIIDFGLAKAIGNGNEGESLYTHAGSFVGTPGYMSPEQCDPSREDIDTRTDVYSLGVVLYVLLAGSTPFDLRDWRKKPFDEMFQVVREQDPMPPSERLSTDRATLPVTAASRSTEPTHLVKQLSGDLDWITLKAMERDRARRYGTPSALAEDVAHYLRNEPVAARPADLGYRLRKYVRRNRVVLSVAGIVAALLITFAIVQSVQLRRTTRERDRADRIAEFMTGIFQASDPSEKLGTVTAAELLDKAAKDIDPGLAHDPELQVSLLHVIGRAYMYQGLFSRAQSIFEQGINISKAHGLQNDRETMTTMHDLAWTLMQLGKTNEAETLERRLLALQQRLFGSEDADTLATESELGFTLSNEGNDAEGVRLNADVLQKQQKILGPEAHYTLVTMDNLAIMLAKNHQLSEAEALQQKSLEIHLKLNGPENLSTINAMINLGEIQRDLGRFEEAKATLLKVLEIESRSFGPNQLETAVTKYDLATLAARNGLVDEAFSYLSQAVDHGLPPLMLLDIANDPMLNSLHPDPRFSALVTRTKERATSQTAN